MMVLWCGAVRRGGELLPEGFSIQDDLYAHWEFFFNHFFYQVSSDPCLKKLFTQYGFTPGLKLL